MTTRNTKKDGSRTYQVPDPNGGEPLVLPSVTTVLSIVAKPALIRWAANQVAQYAIDNTETVLNLLSVNDRDGAYRLLAGSPWAKRDAAAAKGTDVHGLIEAILLGEEPDDPDNKYVAGFRSYSDAVDEWLASEATVYSVTDRWAGTLDALARVGDQVVAIDFKTRAGKSVREARAYETELLQIAAYASAEYLEGPEGPVPMPHVNSGAILMLCEDGARVEAVTIEDHYPAFRSAIDLYTWKQGL